MPELWYPPSRTTARFDGAGPFFAGPKRGVLHTTEGATLEGAISAYIKNNAYPHFTYERSRRIVEQHIPINVAATALVNSAGGVETNRLGAIQIEIVGTCDPANKDRMYFVPEMDQTGLNDLIALMMWIEEQTGIQPYAALVKSYPASYGSNNGVRFSGNFWHDFNGWCGHQNVPENLHGDPGNINMTALMVRKAPEIEYGPVVNLGDGMIKSQNVFIPRFDENGNGWIDTSIPFDNFVNCVIQGPSPDRDTYDWANIYWSANNTNGKTRLEFEGGKPFQALSVSLKWVE